tara:strand:- start:387 stop:716 length:330 start_codon:yes stop_codon:yes gene_type:complete
VLVGIRYQQVHKGGRRNIPDTTRYTDKGELEVAEIDFANDEWNQDERLAYILYQFDGSQAVIDAVNRGKIRHNEWAICMGCDAERPFLNDECLACGGEKKLDVIEIEEK